MAFQVTYGTDEDPDFVLDDEGSSSEDSEWSLDDEPRIGDELPDYAAVEVLLPTRHRRGHATASNIEAAGAGSRHTAARMCAPQVPFASLKLHSS